MINSRDVFCADVKLASKRRVPRVAISLEFKVLSTLQCDIIRGI